MCPFISGKCGSGKKNIILEKEGDTSVIKISGLKSGETCMYQVTAVCGFPHIRNDPVAGVTVQWSESSLDWDQRE